MSFCLYYTRRIVYFYRIYTNSFSAFSPIQKSRMGLLQKQMSDHYWSNSSIFVSESRKGGVAKSSNQMIERHPFPTTSTTSTTSMTSCTPAPLPCLLLLLSPFHAVWPALRTAHSPRWNALSTSSKRLISDLQIPRHSRHAPQV